MNSTALMYVLGVVVCWGLYSVFLHMGSLGMKAEGAEPDPMGNRMKAFLWVGIAYFLIGIVGPALVLKLRGSSWQMPLAGSGWSFVAGLLGAIGAFCLLMALSSGRDAAESKLLIALVPTLVFAGAPLVNAIVSVSKEKLWPGTPPQFFIGLALAALGAGLVMYYKPSAGPGHGRKTGHAPPLHAPAASGGNVAPGYADVTTRRYFVS